MNKIHPTGFICEFTKTIFINHSAQCLACNNYFKIHCYYYQPKYVLGHFELLEKKTKPASNYFTVAQVSSNNNLQSCCCCCCYYVASVVSDSVRPHRRQPTRLPRPWDSPGKNTGVGCHFLLQCMEVKSESEVAQLYPTLCNPMDCSLPGSSIHGIFQARVLEWGAIAFSDL